MRLGKTVLLVLLPVVNAIGLEPSSGWIKYSGNPVIGGQYGTCFDIAVVREAGRYRMWLSWRPKKSIALIESADGIHWDGPPQVVLGPREQTSWEDEVNRPVIVKRQGTYHMWYTGQARGRSSIGYATSVDGRAWKRTSDRPVLTADVPWEKVATMCPHVLWDPEVRLYRMWYSAGEQYEPDAIGYATSSDGLRWDKEKSNPIFRPDPGFSWERYKVSGVQVQKQGDWYLMFYIGFRDVDHAQIGLARSRDGLSGWQRHAANPIIGTTPGAWDADACYKPFALLEDNKWLLWYNGRKGGLEQIGVAFHDAKDLGFPN
ncbi:MAG TPA: family 43 glycosylhydrolase [Patescibacteria group bacterium]|jgi:predicted GH43/DUF377 family glycosyl hydrolase|nr:family 43 glycosylhydrolase [Patescibacteria group bacterium]